MGGARFLLGLADLLAPEDIRIIGNVGDDVEMWGLHVSPDLDTVMYSLAGLADPEQGWGRASETWNALSTVADLEGETWFRLGDRDLGVHLIRTQMLKSGDPLSRITSAISQRLGVQQTLLPATDDHIRTMIGTPHGTFPFQTWFVARRHADPVDSVTYLGADQAVPAPRVLEALEEADIIVITPSNPFTSIGPILAIAEIRSAIERRRVPCVAVSPIIAGHAVKGPAGAMLERLRGGSTPMHLASCYGGLIDALLLDSVDRAAPLPEGVRPAFSDILMLGSSGRRRVASAALDAAILR